MQDNKAIVPPNFYKPSDLMGIFKNFFSHKEINASLLCLQGIYFKSDKIYGNAAWGQLRGPENFTKRNSYSDRNS